MNQEMVNRVRARARASAKAIAQSTDDIEAKLAAVKTARPPLMRQPPQESGGITREQFLGVVERAVK